MRGLQALLIGNVKREGEPAHLRGSGLEEAEGVDVVAHQQVLGLLVVIEHHLVGFAADA